MHETRSCDACSWTPPDVDEVKRRIDLLDDGWGGNFMRLLVESYESSGGRNHYADPAQDAEYLANIVEIVDYIGQKPGVYVLVSLWIDPSFDNQGWPTDDTTGVWEVVADALVDRPHVLFGLVNEPESNFDGAQDADVWQAMNNTVQGIRDVEMARGSRQHIIAVQGTRAWSRHLGYYVDHPITAGGGTTIAYETHSYQTPGDFDEVWASPSNSLPVIIGEYGPADLGGGTEMTLEDTSLMMDEAEARDIPWLAWTFHMRCPPNLLVDNSGGGCGSGMDLAPTEWGTLIKDRLAQPLAP
jgi:endoglucanase